MNNRFNEIWIALGISALVLSTIFWCVHVSDRFSGSIKTDKTITLSIGSGNFISSNGYIITAAHVIDNPSDIHIIYNGSVCSSTQVFSSKKYDISILKENCLNNVPHLSLEQENKIQHLKNENIFYAGNPAPIPHPYHVQFYQGKVLFYDEDMLQSDIHVNHGASGSGVIDNKGNLIGVVQLLYTDTNNAGIMTLTPLYSILKNYATVSPSDSRVLTSAQIKDKANQTSVLIFDVN